MFHPPSAPQKPPTDLVMLVKQLLSELPQNVNSHELVIVVHNNDYLGIQNATIKIDGKPRPIVYYAETEGWEKGSVQLCFDLYDD